MFCKNLLAVLLASALTTACATSAQGILESPVETTVLSDKSPRTFAICVVERFTAANELRDDGARYWILRTNFYGVPITRWDFIRTETGSRAELRTSIKVSPGTDIVEDCA